jgi:uncharacterized protein
MTPQEAQRVTELFDRLASLEARQRDAEAERLIAQGLQQAPHAVYALVQTVLVQDEALRQADARIRELESGGEAQSGGFLDNMRDALFGGGEKPRGSVPHVRPQGAPMGAPPGFGTGSQRPDVPQAQQQAPQPGGGGSFLGTAAAAAAGVIGGSLLLDSIRSMTGGSRQGLADASSGNASPWGGDKAASSDLAKDAGVGDIGQGRDRAAAQGEPQHAYDTAQADYDDEDADVDFDIGGDSDFG